MSITSEQVQALASGSGKVFAGSEKIGGIGELYLDETTGEPSWVTVKTGLFGASESFVPLAGARVDGDDVVVDFSEEEIKGAPRIDPDGRISRDEEAELYRYYGLTDTPDRGAGCDSGDGVDHGVAGLDDDRDTSGPSTDDAMTRSEEHLNVGTQSRESGRARLRKYVTTETETREVPVRHEEARIKREPITDENRGTATAGADISEAEHEVVLHEEVPVVQKETVPVERVRLDTETVTENVTVTDELKKEHIDVDGDGVDNAGVDQDDRTR